ncbi:MAG TPA: protein kinase [Polyangiaceae bacterium]
MSETRDSDDFVRAVAEAPERTPGAADPAYVAHFRIVSRLGSGGMGVVYRAEDVKLRRTVALKVLRPELAAGDEHRTRFLREARSAAAITYPHVAAIYEVGEVDGRAYLAMEFVDGKTLRQTLGGGPLSVAEAVRIATETARGLAKAHERGVVHRDLKPENIMLDEDGRVKILDFGIAKLRDVAAAPATSVLADTQGQPTQAGAVLGTPGYMSPEQARGENVDARTDLFSLGAVLYEALAGHAPFRGETGFDVLIATIRDAPASLGEVRPEVPAALDAIVSRCLAKSREGRFADAAALAEALEGLPAAPVATPVSPPSVPPRRRRSGPLGWAAAVVVALAALGALAVWHGPGAGPVPVPVDRPSPVSAPGPTAITDLPPPKTSNPQAGAAYAAAMQSMRDANLAGALGHFFEARELDPRFAAVHLRLADVDPGAGDESLDERRAYLQTALANRASLDAHDTELLRVTTLRLAADPDMAGVVRESQSLAARFPLDADLEAHLGDRLAEAGRTEEALAAYGRATELDPKFAQVWFARALALLQEGDLDGARTSLSRCLEVSPSAATCIRERSTVLMYTGRCEELEPEARRLLAIDPNGSVTHWFLADALVASGAPGDSVRSALHLRTLLEAVPRRRADWAVEEDELPAFLAGDFQTLREAAKRREVLVASETSEARHAGAVYERGVADYEMGDLADLTAVADAYASHASAWTADDPSMRGYVMGVRRRAGHLSAAELEQSRSALLTERRGRLPPALAKGLWTSFYAIPAETGEDARIALAALPAFTPLPPSPTDIRAPEAVGRVYLLAGEPAQAIAPLRTAARSCLGLEEVWERTRAHEELGEALEATGDKEGACAAYATVVGLWGHAKPRSVTAEKAKAHARRLGCGG